MFDRVYVVNLKRRPDRLASFRLMQESNGWKLPEVDVFDAIEGDSVGVPNYFTQGGGAWGCLRSHVTILERCIMEGVDSVLMLEDDVTWHGKAWEELERFMSVVPTDWHQLMLGGQHIRQPKILSEGVGKVSNTQRTHAYAIRGAAMKSLLNLWYTASVHIDWAMGDWQRGWNVYCPEPFIFGQTGGKSDISGQTNPAKFWNSPSLAPVVHLTCPLGVMQRLRGHGLHTGYTRDEFDIDKGLNDVVKSRQKIGQLSRWLDTLAWEAASQEGLIVCVYHPEITADEVREAHKGEVIEVTGDTVEACLTQMAGLKLKPSRCYTHVAIVRASRPTVEALGGFHKGHWVDTVTGQDQGIREAAVDRNKTKKLQEWVKAVSAEAERIGAVPLIWHDAISVDDMKLAAPDRTIVELAGETVEDIMRQWKLETSKDAM
jgi:GR25 family glycosyltransferase involved in LPS biosynthesis